METAVDMSHSRECTKDPISALPNYGSKGKFGIFYTKIQGGRRYFSRRETTTLVGGPGNMAVYRHILVIPPTAKIVTAEKRKTAYRRNITAVLHYRRKNTAMFWFYRFRQL